ncbi:MAG: polyprenyl synthetase family protein [Bacteroidetes bacterium]|nr:polyprenyl synthetase family protein [Bacteroidota bacterium]
MKQYEHLFRLFHSYLEQYRIGLHNRKPAELYKPEDYILSLGGKRLRPLLALIACDLFDRAPDKALDSALCVELFHNFSLIHDDILDAAPLRRNQATVHTKWNTNIAILSGDVMLVKAFHVLNKYSQEESRELSFIFSNTAIEVCEGQQLDMNFESIDEVTVDQYLHMITLKTAVLLGCSLKMGAINAGAQELDQQNIYEFGKHLGIAFQLLDDVLDAYAGTPEFGKQIGGDIIANKKTYLLLKATELASDRQKKELDHLLKLGKESSQEKIAGIKVLFDELHVKELCIERANKHTSIAINHLKNLPVSEFKKENLRQFALELLKRNV